MTDPTSDIAFSPAVKAAQDARGSREMYARREAQGGFRSKITPELLSFLATIDTAYLATASADGQPYAQHRGGPPGFIRALGPDLLGFADYAGNQQYITTGNLSENDRAFLFLMDYARARRVKLWGHARMTNDRQIIERLMPEGYAAEPRQALLFTVLAWDTNCSQHIPRKVNIADINMALGQRDGRIKELEADVARLRRAISVAASRAPLAGRQEEETAG